MHQRLLVTVLLSALTVAACGKKAEPPTPIPQTQDDDAARRAQEEAARQAEQERLAAERAAAERRAAEEAQRRARAALTEMIHFGLDQFDISPEAAVTLRTKADVMRANGDVRLRIEGHADQRGSNEYNLALGMRRATAARDFLTNFGIEPRRFEVVSYGEDRPLATGESEAAWAQNRRAEFHVTAGGDDLVVPGSLQ